MQNVMYNTIDNVVCYKDHSSAKLKTNYGIVKDRESNEVKIFSKINEIDDYVSSLKHFESFYDSHMQEEGEKFLKYASKLANPGKKTIKQIAVLDKTDPSGKGMAAIHTGHEILYFSKKFYEKAKKDIGRKFGLSSDAQLESVINHENLHLYFGFSGAIGGERALEQFAARIYSMMARDEKDPVKKEKYLKMAEHAKHRAGIAHINYGEKVAAIAAMIEKGMSEEEIEEMINEEDSEESDSEE